jgi:hypothetical protein
MEATIATAEATLASPDDDLLLDLEKLSDIELAQIGGGAGAFLL